MIYFSIGKQRKRNWFGPITNLFSFSTAQTEKNPWKKLGKQIDEFVIHDFFYAQLSVYGCQVPWKREESKFYERFLRLMNIRIRIQNPSKPIFHGDIVHSAELKKEKIQREKKNIKLDIKRTVAWSQ